MKIPCTLVISVISYFKENLNNSIVHKMFENTVTEEDRADYGKYILIRNQCESR